MDVRPVPPDPVPGRGPKRSAGKRHRPDPSAAPPAAPPAGETAAPEDSLIEEIANAVTHGIGAGLAIAALVILIVEAASGGSALAILAVILYGLTLFVLFLSSTLYHSIPHRGTREVTLTLDHCGIFLLIAGTYTPITIISLSGWQGWLLFGLIWGLALVGIAIRLFWIKDQHPVFIVLYVAMGWMGFIWSKSLGAALGVPGVNLILIGGLFYTAGLIFFSWRRLPFNHMLWHLSVLAGSIFHFFAMVYYVVPKAV